MLNKALFSCQFYSIIFFQNFENHIFWNRYTFLTVRQIVKFKKLNEDAFELATMSAQDIVNKLETLIDKPAALWKAFDDNYKK